MKTLILCYLFPGLYAAGTDQSHVPEWKDSCMKVLPKTDRQAYAFNLQEVRLPESTFYTAMQAEAKYLWQIGPDRLLSDFRAQAGLKPKAEKYGGWECSGLAGHYLSALNFKIQVNGKTIATEDLNRYKASKFYDISYIIPEELAKGKASVVIKFRARAAEQRRAFIRQPDGSGVTIFRPREN